MNDRSDDPLHHERTYLGGGFYFVYNIPDVFRFSGRDASDNVQDEQGVVTGAWLAHVHEQSADKHRYT